MSGKITNYFKRTPSLPRKADSVHKPNSSNKKMKINDENEMNSLNSPSPKRQRMSSGDLASPEQKVRAENNKVRAELLKLSKELAVCHDGIGPTWFKALQPEFSKPYFRQLSEFVTTERGRATVFPTREEVWSWTTRTPIHDVRVVILGQDPYHGPGQAHGLCFSVKPGVRSPPSLLNMYKELATDIEGFTKPDHGHLTGWADQGVLLLNAVLTVTSAKANSHKDRGWEKLTDAVIKWISDNCDGVVFLLWGAYAQKKGAYVDKSRHHILHSTHPSPLSAHRGFLGCKHFSKCNELLEQAGKVPIDWKRLPR